MSSQNKKGKKKVVAIEKKDGHTKNGAKSEEVPDSTLESKDNTMKRSEDETSSPVKRKKKKGEPHYQQPKNALMQLYELKPGLQYVVEHTEGPPHDPVFVMSVKVNNEVFHGRGRSKQLAKHAAAEAALASFIQFPNTSDSVKLLNRENVRMDFTDDNLESDGKVFGEHKRKDNQPFSKGAVESTYLQHRLNNKLRKLISETDKKNPLMLLHELHPGLEFRVVAENEASTGERFLVAVDVDGKTFNGTGQTKQLAKASAARDVLSQKYGLNAGTSQGLDDTDKMMFEVPQAFADGIAKLVHDSMDRFSTRNPKCEKWRVLAGVVMTKDKEMNDMQIVCLGTGAKVLNGENLSFNGAALNDCHAEIIARRSLKDFFYTQLELYLNGNGHKSIFQKTNTKFKLKPNINFHFYVTSIPCGDAAMFSADEKPNVSGLNLNTTEHGSGMLRSKLEFGTIPVGSASNEQKPEEIRRKVVRYQIMSCSDKITSWNVLGVQGSLLSYFIEPVYFQTVIFGRTFHGYHMLNCMFKRIENKVERLPYSFSLHKPKFSHSSTWLAKTLTDVPKISLNWTSGLENPELVLATTGKPREAPVSRLAKRSFFQRFCSLRSLLPAGSTVPQSRWYDKIKSGSLEYHQAKEIVMNAFYGNGLGRWKKKPDEQDMFDLTF